MNLRTLFALGASIAFLGAQDGLNNEAVIKMVKAGLSETVIVSMIGSQPGKFSMAIDDLVKLKEAGVSDKIVGAMASHGNAPARSVSPAPSAADSAPKRETGVYYKKGSEWVEVLPEVVNLKTGGTLKSLASAGVVKKDLNGNLPGPASRNSVTNPPEFEIITPEGVAITEYQLIRLRINKDYREFRTVTGGIFNQQSGAMRDIVPFEGKRVAARTFSVVLPSSLGAGQYGFLAPGAVGSSGNMAAQIGKMYTFHILE